ncbi:hypothetical protein TIFTF001_028525 [Ficus carica]|uniref:Uncharacterized protein n=1 Tax=Ficus carica TaxID=3494 RepID=A0AA88DQ31_FICCA|nr:hypothetical protein TIFTF001_028525 [Ficus carica]
MLAMDPPPPKPNLLRLPLALALTQSIPLFDADDGPPLLPTISGPHERRSAQFLPPSRP